MANYRYFVSLVLFFLPLCLSLKAQDCFDYYRKSCISPDSKFVYSLNKSSVSFKFKSGEQRIVTLPIFSGKDYRITICADNVFDNVIQFRLIKDDGELLYDNSTNDYSFHVEFSCVKSQDLSIELNAPKPSAGTADTIYYEGCIGILIEDMVSIKTGF